MRTLGLLLLSLTAAPATAQEKTLSPEQARDLFLTRVKPMLVAKCAGCHGDDAQKLRGGLDLRTLASALRGGKTGPALVPGHPEKSLLLQLVQRADPARAMPPKETDKLTREQIDWLRQWIAAG